MKTSNKSVQIAATIGWAAVFVIFLLRIIVALAMAQPLMLGNVLALIGVIIAATVLWLEKWRKRLVDIFLGLAVLGGLAFVLGIILTAGFEKGPSSFANTLGAFVSLSCWFLFGSLATWALLWLIKVGDEIDQEHQDRVSN